MRYVGLRACGDGIVLVDGDWIGIETVLRGKGEGLLARVSFVRRLGKGFCAHSSQFAQTHEYFLNSDRSILTLSVRTSF